MRHEVDVSVDAARRVAATLVMVPGYHLSLDDPLLSRFIGGFVEKMLENLGMNEDEPLESQLISRRIKAAQKKIEQQAFGNSRAFSASEWLELNMPNV